MLNELRLKKVKSCVQTAAYLPYFLSWVILPVWCRYFWNTRLPPAAAAA